jgi:hypothetical protein
VAAQDGVDATSARLVITPAGGAQSTIVYTKLEVQACIKGTATCSTASCVPASVGQPCTAELTALTSGATYTATAVGVVDQETSLESGSIEFSVLYP